MGGKKTAFMGERPTFVGDKPTPMGVALLKRPGRVRLGPWRADFR